MVDPAYQRPVQRPGFFLSVSSAIHGVYFISRQISTEVVDSCQHSWLCMTLCTGGREEEKLVALSTGEKVIAQMPPADLTS